MKTPFARFVPTIGSFLVALVALVALVSASPNVFAQAAPAFTFVKPDEAKKGAPAVEWKAQVKGGAVISTGNSQSKAGTFAATASRKEGSNKLALDAALAYGTSNATTPVVDMATNTVTGVDRQSITSTNNWLGKGRYDRFFTANNAGYASAQGGADKIAGKSFYGGGQIGYSRQLHSTAKNLLVAEIGYDFSYEQYVPQPMKTIDPVSIHSARVFVGETLTLTPETGITGSLEALFNVNKEDKALNAARADGTTGVDPFEDTRVVGKLGLTTTLVKSLSFGFGFTLKYDQNPAPLPLPATAPAGSSFAPTFHPFAEKVDTITEATLIYTFL